MPNNISPPPYHDPDVNSQVWRTWFTQLRQALLDTTSGGGGDDTTITITNLVDQTPYRAPTQTALGAGTCVYPTAAGQVGRADPSDPITRNVIGVVGRPYAAGEIADVHTYGDMSVTIHGYTPGQPLFVGAGGALSHIPPEQGWVLLVGTATATNSLVLHWEPSVELFTPS